MTFSPSSSPLHHRHRQTPNTPPSFAEACPEQWLTRRVVLLTVIVAECFAVACAVVTQTQTQNFLADLTGFSICLQSGLLIKWLTLLGAIRCRVPWAAGAPSAAATAWLALGGGAISGVTSYLPGAVGAYTWGMLIGIDALVCIAVLLAGGACAGLCRWRAAARQSQDCLSHRALRHHFLLNTLNTTAYLIHQQPAVAEDNLVKLADLYRTILRQKPTVTLNEEIMMTRHYLDVEKTRLGDRLNVVWQLDELLPMDAPMPAMVLQPLAENAVYHGIEPAAEHGIMIICIGRDGQGLSFELSNPNPRANQRSNARSCTGNRFAQQAIDHRLRQRYGAAGGLRIRETRDQYFVSFHISF